MNNALFTIGNVTFYAHGFMAVLGIVSGALIAYIFAMKKGLKNSYFFDLIIYTTLFGIIGARIAYFILYNDQFSNLNQLFFLWQGGLVSYGGFLLGGLAFVIILKLQKQPVFKWLDVSSAGFFFGLFLGRIGCLISGEYGGAYLGDKKFLNYFPAVPISLFEALLCLLIFITTVFIISRYYLRIKTGIVFLSSAAIYTLGRFIIDIWRIEPDWFWIFSIGQVCSALLFIGALTGIIFLIKKGSDYHE